MACKCTRALPTAAMFCYRAAALAGYFSGVSNIVQHQMSDMFEDTEWLLGFIEENSKRLGAAYDAIAGLHIVPIVSSSTGRAASGHLLMNVTAA